MAAEAAISSAVELLGDLLIQKVKFLRGVEGKVELLKDELKRMQSFLKDANRKQAEDERVRNWISEIREVAHDAQDAIEMFLVNVENRRGLLKSVTSFSKRMFHLDRIGDEIESIRARLDAIDKSRERYGIRGFGEAADSARRLQVESRRRLPSWQKDEHLVGVEEDTKKLLRESILDEEKKGLSIAVVEGMGGIGKSTLARAIYNHPDVVADRFDRYAWVVVSSEFTPQETIKQLIFRLPRSEEEKQKLLEEIKKLEESMRDKLYLQEELKGMLYKQLEGKSFFIVLDDVWEKEHFESLVSAFPNQQDKRSRLLVTTRNKITTKYDRYVHKMKLLDPEKSWELFLKKAFIGSNTNGKCPEELERIGRQILEKCHGLPLAITVVGGLLVETQNKTKWEEVLNSQINSYLGTAESSVSTILELSYQNLSLQLKSCFLCLAFFKEDATIPVKRLVNIWVGQGLIQQEGNITIDEIARGYLNELINRSMLQIEDLIIDVENCRLHDLVREVCLRKAKEEIGLEIVKSEEGISSQSSSYKPRHRVVYGKNLETSSSKQNNHIRSLFLFNVNGEGDFYMTTPSHYWKSFRLLNMLELDGFAFQRLPDSFRLLIGLKCLRIHKSHSMYGEILALPSWLDNLKNLEVLDMGWGGVKFPRLVSLKMDRLRYFRASIVRGPMRIENWKHIQCVKDISHKDWMRCSSNLMSGCRLRELGISFNGWMEPQELSKVRASLERLQNLATLHLIWSFTPFDLGLTIPHLHTITKLKLTGMMLRCPAASVFPPNLSRLTLEVSYLEEDPMEELGKLPKLVYLKLHKRAYSGETMQVLHDGFPCLKALSLWGLHFLRRIGIEEGGMPRLKHLLFRYCPALQTKNLRELINKSAE